MSKAKQAKQSEKEVFVGSQRGKNRDAFGLQKVSMKMVGMFQILLYWMRFSKNMI